MNLRLSNSIRTWVDNVKTADTFTPETGIRMMSDLSKDLVVTYDELDRTMPADWRTKAGEKFEVLDFIDPQVALPLTEVEGMMQRSRNTRHSRGVVVDPDPEPDGGRL